MKTIHQLIAIAALEAAKVAQPVKPTVTIDNEHMHVRFTIGVQTFSLHVDFPEEDGRLEWYAEQLEKAFDKLVAQPVVPQGWKLVPIEPTDEMLVADCDLDGFVGVDDTRKLYTAMLAAAPAPLVEPVQTTECQLRACDQSTGREYFIKSGNREALQAEADRMNSKGHDYFVLPKLAPSAPAVEFPVVAWIPISQQMPRSGQTVLALQEWDHSGKQSVIRAQWTDAKTEESNSESDISEYDEVTDTYYDPEGWYERISHWDEYCAVAVTGAKVTHWMPLPEIPGTATTAGAKHEK
jgi:hypothetical protein